ncbi:MAG: SH3 domain-containing protein [Opitutaceae bacterium]|nr:SH3 domain-containing protein [Opitutaceae bacterium]
MKTTLNFPTAVLLLARAAAAGLAASLSAAPLMETTAIHAQPDAASPAIGYLKAGTEPAAANATAPEGWMAIELPGPHEAYVNNNDFSKSLDIHAGAAIRLQPKADAPVLTTMQEGDKVEITGLRSGWTQIKLAKTIPGYIRIGGAPSAPPAAIQSIPAAPPALTAGPSTPVISSGPAAALPRMFQGVFAETKRILLIGPRRDYAYQLNNLDGRRIAFLDVTRLLATDKMEPYVGRSVTVAGVLRQTPDGKNLVIEVETLELK